MDLISIKKL